MPARCAEVYVVAPDYAALHPGSLLRAGCGNIKLIRGSRQLAKALGAMNQTNEDLKVEGKSIYRNAANQALAGFQLIEEMLKSYIEMHFNMTREILAGRLHFDFRRDDYQDAALGRLTQVFSKICPDKTLIADLRSIVKRRDHIAHRALLKLYEDDIALSEYSTLIDELSVDMKRNGEIMTRVVKAMDHLRH